jgi:PAS domain S-box-containing protein
VGRQVKQEPADDRYNRTVITMTTRLQESGRGTAVLAPDGTYLEIDEAWCRLLGFKPVDIVGTSDIDLQHPDDHLKLLTLGDWFAEGTLHITRRWRHGLTGTYMWLEVELQRIMTSSGETAYLTVLINEVPDAGFRIRVIECPIVSLEEALSGIRVPIRSPFVDRRVRQDFPTEMAQQLERRIARLETNQARMLAILIGGEYERRAILESSDGDEEKLRRLTYYDHCVQETLYDIAKA